MPDIEVTDEMIEAGERAYTEIHEFGFLCRRAYAAIYRAMRAKERESEADPIPERAYLHNTGLFGR